MWVKQAEVLIKSDWEHLNNFAQPKTSSHMLKHAVGQYEGQDMSEIKFGMKIICQAKSNFE